MKVLTVEELPRLRDIGREFTAAAKRKHPFNEQHFEAVWTNLLNLGVGRVFYEENDDGKIVGAFAFVVNPDMFSGVLAFAEIFLYVLPEARGGGLAGQLIERYEQEAKERGISEILMVSLAELETGPIFIRRGYQLAESIYRKEL